LFCDDDKRRTSDENNRWSTMPQPAIFSTHTIRSVTFRNRLWVTPMCQYSVERMDGVPTDWHLVHLGSFASGGAGLIMTEATGVSAVGRISAEDTGIYTDEQRDAWRRIVDFIHSQGAAAGLQLGHAGRKASVYRRWSPVQGTRPIAEHGWQTVAPSAIAFEGYDTPVELTKDEIAGIVAAFASAPTNTAAASRIARGCCSRSCAPSAPPSGRRFRCSCGSRHPTTSRTAGTGNRPRPRPAGRRRPGRTCSTSRPVG
jgi:hypothetical protein